MGACLYDYRVFDVDLVFELFRPLVDPDAYISDDRAARPVHQALRDGFRWVRTDQYRAVFERAEDVRATLVYEYRVLAADVVMGFFALKNHPGAKGVEDDGLQFVQQALDDGFRWVRTDKYLAIFERCLDASGNVVP